MSLIDALRVSFRALSANGLRTFLTMLGMMIGVGSVIVLIAVGQGASKGVQDQIRSLGEDLLFVRPGAPTSQQTTQRGAQQPIRTLTLTDAEALVTSGIGGIEGVAAQVDTTVQAIAGDNNRSVTMIGTTPEYAEVRGGEVVSGTFITAENVEKKQLAIVLGSEVAAGLFPGADPLGQTVRVAFGNTRFDFNVVGVMAERGGSGGQDDYVFTPVTVLQSRIGFLRNASGETLVTQINVKAADRADKDLLVAEITAFLQERHEVTSADFTIQTQDDLVGAAGEVSRTLSILLGSIAGISLVVGGIGVMNIMLVSVTERTREIGIRRAVGARRADIVKQFVTEALVLCIAGGVGGILIGGGIAMGLNGRTLAGEDMSTVVQPWSVLVAFSVAAGIGALSGSYPAIRASRLDPITALRSD